MCVLEWRKHWITAASMFDLLPVGVRVVMHEPRTVVVHIHGPGFIIFPQHSVLRRVDARHTERRVRVVIVAIDAELPVMNSFGESSRSEHHAVVVAVAAHRLVLVGHNDVSVR